MKKDLGKLAIQRETLRIMERFALAQAVRGASGESECVSHCLSDGFPGNCRRG